ncbi:MAG: hypothetical protein JWN14_2887 [Chthonomonadales bacterium]|nr:hypothetical protein [Chthonomonadales bacterium]
MKNDLTTLLNFIHTLEANRIFYELHKHSYRKIMVSVAVPGERWEIEFGEDGEVDVEKFVSTGGVGGKERLAELFERFSEPPDNPTTPNIPGNS